MLLGVSKRIKLQHQTDFGEKYENTFWLEGTIT